METKYVLKDEQGKKYGTYTEEKEAALYAQEAADDLQQDIFIYKETSELHSCVIPE